VGRTPERRGRASTLRAEECEGPGGATACCESTVASEWYQSLEKEVLFVKVIGRNIFENATQKGATVT
jgi:hypothetical protein